MDIILEGHLTYDTVPEASAGFFKQISQATVSQIAVQLSKVVDVDSSGIAMLVEGVRLARDKGLTLTYVDCSDALHQFIDFCGLSNVLGISVG